MSDDKQRWFAAAHAMQSGVAAEMNIIELASQVDPKHLRVGVNTAMSDHGGLVTLLIEKGVITEAEYVKAIADAMEREKASYEKRLSDFYGKPITLV